MSGSSFAQPIDQTVLDAARAGDRSAREKIYRQFERQVYSLALRMCQNPDEACDVTQDTFIHVLSKLNQFRGDSPFWGWLRTIAVNTTLGHLRKRSRPLALVSTEFLEQQSLTEERPGDQCDLASALGRLPDDTRAVVWLHDVEGYTHGEIAKLFGKSVSFSKSRLSRAHQQLRNWLETEQKVCPEIIQVS